jgi:hypothetical protein
MTFISENVLWPFNLGLVPALAAHAGDVSKIMPTSIKRRTNIFLIVVQMN